MHGRKDENKILMATEYTEAHGNIKSTNKSVISVFRWKGVSKLKQKTTEHTEIHGREDEGKIVMATESTEEHGKIRFINKSVMSEFRWKGVSKLKQF